MVRRWTVRAGAEHAEERPSEESLRDVNINGVGVERTRPRAGGGTQVGSRALEHGVGAEVPPKLELPLIL
jgi:hypothetical protein